MKALLYIRGENGIQFTVVLTFRTSS